MSEYLITPPSGGLRSWGALVKESRISFTKDQLELGQALIARSEFPPEGEHILHMSECCSSSNTTQMLCFGFSDYAAAHPALLLSLAAGIDGSSRESAWQYMQYTQVVSPFLLTDERGKNFVFTFERRERGFHGWYEDLEKKDWFPRCMHVWLLPPHRREQCTMFFRKGTNGYFGEYFACRDGR